MMIFRELHAFVQDMNGEPFGEEGGKSIGVKARCLTLNSGFVFLDPPRECHMQFDMAVEFGITDRPH